MLIHVTYHDDSYDLVMPHRLEELIATDAIKRFYRLDGWAVVDEDRLRGGGGDYDGAERRVGACLAQQARMQQALINLLDRTGLVSKRELSEEIGRSRIHGGGGECLGTASWLILVTYRDDSCDLVMPHRLEELLEAGKAKTFHRADGWVVVGTDPLRGAACTPAATERRASPSELLVRAVQVEEALTDLLDKKGLVSKRELSEELAALGAADEPDAAMGGRPVDPDGTGLVDVIDLNDALDLIPPDCLEELIGTGEIKAFRRTEGWVLLESDKIRRGQDRHDGPNRRMGLSITERLQRLERIFEARINLLDRKGSVRKRELDDELEANG